MADDLLANLTATQERCNILLEETRAERKAKHAALNLVTLLQEQVAALQGEILEARNEASVVRRAYLHERGRANAAVRMLALAGELEEASRLDEQAYRGSADR